MTEKVQLGIGVTAKMVEVVARYKRQSSAEHRAKNEGLHYTHLSGHPKPWAVIKDCEPPEVPDYVTR